MIHLYSLIIAQRSLIQMICNEYKFLTSVIKWNASTQSNRKHLRFQKISFEVYIYKTIARFYIEGRSQIYKDNKKKNH